MSAHLRKYSYRWIILLVGTIGTLLVTTGANVAIASTARSSNVGAFVAARSYVQGTSQTGEDPPPVPTPSWWNGTCDSNRGGGGYEITSWDGLIACGPPSTGLEETGPLAPNSEWQCVELSERWLYQEFGLPVQNPGGADSDGWQIVNDYWNYLQANPGAAPLSHFTPSTATAGDLGPGDVVSYGSSDPGHTNVVISVSLNSSGTGTMETLNQNYVSGGNDYGEVQLSVTNWVPGSVGGVGAATGWLHWTGSGSTVLPGPGDFGSFNRYVNSSALHYETVRAQPTGYSFEASLGELLMVQVHGTVALYSCLQGTDEFTSLSSTCEGQQVIGFEGFAYSSAPTGIATVPLYRCRVTSNNTHFDSNDPNCEGQTVDGFLGYLLATGWPVIDPQVTSATPDKLGQGASKVKVVVTGTGFETGATVAVSGSGVTVVSTTVASVTSLDVVVSVTASVTVGSVNLTVTNPDSGTATCTGCLTIDPGPQISKVKPSSFAAGTTKSIIITGTGFVAHAKVAISGSGVTVTAVNVVNSTEITATVKVASSASSGSRTLTVKNPDHGKASATVSVT